MNCSNLPECYFFNQSLWLNTTFNGTKTHYSILPGRAYCTVVVIVISVLVTLTNMINLFVLRLTEQIPEISRMCLMNLSCADLIVGLLSCLPATYPAVHAVWPYGSAWCQVSGVIHGTSCNMSIWSLGLVSVDRYIAIVHPLRYYDIVTKPRCVKVLCVMWCVAATTFLVPIFTKPDYTYYRFDEAELMCAFTWEYAWFCIVTAMGIPILTGGLLIYTTVCVIREIAKPRNNQVEPAVFSQVQDGLRVRDMRCVKVLTITSCIFYTNWGPYTVTVVMKTFLPGINTPPLLRFLFLWLANANSFINVFVYSFIYSRFRREVASLLKSVFTCFQSQEPQLDASSDNQRSGSTF